MQTIYMGGRCLKTYLQTVLNGKNISKFDEKFIKNYYEDSDKGYIFEIDVEYPKKLHNFHNDLPISPERMKIKKCHKLVCNLYDKNNYVAHIRTLKRALNNGLIVKKVHKIFQFYQKAWLKSYVNMNTKLRTEAKMTLKKSFLI